MTRSYTAGELCALMFKAKSYAQYIYDTGHLSPMEDERLRAFVAKAGEVARALENLPSGQTAIYVNIDESTP